MLTYEDAYGAPEEEVEKETQSVETTETEEETTPVESSEATDETTETPTDKADESTAEETAPEPDVPSETPEEDPAEEGAKDDDAASEADDAEKPEVPVEPMEPASNKTAVDFDTLYAPAEEEEKSTEEEPTESIDGDKPSDASEEEKKEDGGEFAESDYEAAADAIATLESMKVNTKAIGATGSVPASIVAVVSDTTNALLRRFKIDYDKVTYESTLANTDRNQKAICLLDNAIALLKDKQATLTSK